MPRASRVIVPGIPLHIRQRGVNRCTTFHAPEDFAFYRWALREASTAAGCAVHAYVLMTNHVHLLVTPRDSIGPASMMRSLGMRYVHYFNRRHQRTGTLWEGRYRSGVIDSAAYLFACSRYIELNPVRAAMASGPDDYTWSSHASNARADDDPIITPHPEYLALAPTRAARAAAYHALFAAPLEDEVVAALRALRHGRETVRPVRGAQAAGIRASAASLPAGVAGVAGVAG